MRTFLLAPVLVCLLFVAVAELGHPAAGKARPGGIIAALEDPLSLFADRSPGGRGSGPLLSTKPGIGPEERVLSQVREREPPLGDPAAGDPLSPVTPEDIAALPNGLPSSGGLPGSGDPPGVGGDPGLGPAFFSPSFPNALSDPPIIPGGGAPPGSSDPLPPTLPGTPAVPEPATWAMMILGFFGVGAAVRRRARKGSGPACVPQP